MKTYTLIFALSFISSIALAQTQKNATKPVDSTSQQKAALVGGALPGGSVISAAVSKIDNNSMPSRISMNVTVAKQTQGSTFGEKVSQGLHAAGSALANGASKTTEPAKAADNPAPAKKP
jgi:uncharacterized protein YdeI (BOF family)